MRKELLFAGKVFVAAIALVGLVSIPAKQLAPNLTLLELAGVILCAVIAVTILTIASLTVAQWVLRAGGTDPQWFWFRGEPLGLQELREQAREGKRHAQ